MSDANFLRELCLKTDSLPTYYFLDELGPETSNDSSLLCIGVSQPTFRILIGVGSTQSQKRLGRTCVPSE